MSLFYMAFATDMQPLLVDARDDAHASEIGAHVAEGVAPSRVVPIPPGIFVAGLFTEPEDGGDEIIVDPLPHVEDYLEKVDAAISGNAETETCSSEADAEDGEVVRCELEPSHEGMHEGTTSAGEVVRWCAGD